MSTRKKPSDVFFGFQSTLGNAVAEALRQEAEKLMQDAKARVPINADVDAFFDSRTDSAPVIDMQKDASGVWVAQRLCDVSTT